MVPGTDPRDSCALKPTSSADLGGPSSSSIELAFTWIQRDPVVDGLGKDHTFLSVSFKNSFSFLNEVREFNK